MKRAIIIAAALAVAGGLSVLGEAQAQTAAQPCFEVVAATGPSAAAPPFILVDRCTGKTWMLLRLVMTDSEGAVSGPSQFNYRWLPIPGVPPPPKP